MTHKEIYTKFMIEYDKANITSSYPSLTEYEVATILDKAYLALINQKITGNNVRKTAFEEDVKSVADIQPLVTTKRIQFGTGVDKAGEQVVIEVDTEAYPDPVEREQHIKKDLFNLRNLNKKGLAQFPKTNQFYEETTTEQYTRQNASILNPLGESRPTEQEYISTSARAIPDNVRELKIPEDMLYYVAGAIPVDIRLFSGAMNDVKYAVLKSGIEADDKEDGATVLDYAQKLIPLDNKLRDFYRREAGKIGETKHYRMQSVKLVSHAIAEKFFATAYNIPWVKVPVAYLEGNYLFVVVDPVVGIAELPYTETGVEPAGAAVEDDDCAEWMSLTYVKNPAKFAELTEQEGEEVFAGLSNSDTEFELNDSMAEELISLAISFSLENVESPRLNTHLGIRGLES